MTTPKTILLTGATGVVGTALLRRLAGHRVLAITHRNAVVTRSFQGDVTRTRLGLDPVAYATLADAVDTVVHCAAITGFDAGREATHAVNVGGTAQVLRFARDAGAPLVYVSTAYVARSTRTARGGAAGDAIAEPDHYVDSKRAAEDLVRESRLPAAIVRPSLVIGDAVTGEITQFQSVLGLMHAVLKGVLPLVPIDPAATVDVVPRDLVADAIAALVERDAVRGEHWLTAGAAAPTAARIMELTVATARRLGLDAAPARLVRPDQVDRLIRPVFIEGLPPALRRRFDDVLAMTGLFHTAEPFRSSLADLPGVAAPTRAGIEDAFRASIGHLAATKGLLRAARPALATAVGGAA
jgi:nucleoside-diphosphate-sugar epimerase